MKDLSLFWALKKNKLVHVSEVQSGLKCECICPSCNKPLVAHKGKIKIHHFKHYEVCNCQGSIETSIHLAAKKLFLTKKEVLLPDLYADVPEFGEQKVQSRKLYKSKKVIEEYKIDDFQPDIFMEVEIKKKGKVYLAPLIIEIAVTHFVDSVKLNKIINKGISAIEICLDKIERIKNNDELWNELINHDKIRWLFNSKLPILIKKKRENAIQHQKNIDNKILRLEQQKEDERKEFEKQKIPLRKIYNFRKDYGRRDMTTGFTQFEGTVYCPKDKINKDNRPISLNECVSCNYHLKLHFATTYGDSEVYVACEFKL